MPPILSKGHPTKSLDDLLFPPDVSIELASSNYAGKVAPEAREKVAWHYDASRTDKGALAWFDSPDFKLSYNRAYTDNGRRVRLTPSIWNRAYHFGDALPPGNANTRYFGLAVTAGAGDLVTDQQFEAIVYDTAIIFRFMGWGPDEVEKRLVGHNEEAIFTKGNTPSRSDLWGKLGRKPDPIGPDPDKPVLSLVSGRIAVSLLLEDATRPIWTRWDV